MLPLTGHDANPVRLRPCKLLYICTPVPPLLLFDACCLCFSSFFQLHHLPLLLCFSLPLFPCTRSTIRCRPHAFLSVARPKRRLPTDLCVLLRIHKTMCGYVPFYGEEHFFGIPESYSRSPAATGAHCVARLLFHVPIDGIIHLRQHWYGCLGGFSLLLCRPAPVIVSSLG